jgi:putative N6-adenine-specific DNA methylase
LYGQRIAPGAARRFSIERWPGVPTGIGKVVRSELAEIELRDKSLLISGSDRDAGAIVASKSNAERAGVHDVIEFAERSISAAEFVGETGWVVANPPYGVRVGEADRVRDLWARFGSVLRERARGWRVVLLSPDPALDRQLGFPVQVLASTTNGGIPVRIISGAP